MSDPFSSKDGVEFLNADSSRVMTIAMRFNNVSNEAPLVAEAITGAGGQKDWTGHGSDAYRKAATMLPPDFALMHTAFADVTKALMIYSGWLLEYQPAFKRLASDYATAQENVAAAQQGVSSAQSEVTRTALYPIGDPRIAAATTAHQLAQGTLEDYESTRDSIRQEGESWLAQFREQRGRTATAVANAVPGQVLPARELNGMGYGEYDPNSRARIKEAIAEAYFARQDSEFQSHPGAFHELLESIATPFKNIVPDMRAVLADPTDAAAWTTFAGDVSQVAGTTALVASMVALPEGAPAEAAALADILGTASTGAAFAKVGADEVALQQGRLKGGMATLDEDAASAVLGAALGKVGPKDPGAADTAKQLEADGAIGAQATDHSEQVGVVMDGLNERQVEAGKAAVGEIQGPIINATGNASSGNDKHQKKH